MQFDCNEINEKLENMNVFDVLKWCYNAFSSEKIALSTSFGAEGMVLVHMLADMVGNPRVFTIDTGRNFQETYTAWQEVIKRYGITIDTYYPAPVDIQNLIKDQGPNMFYESSENRKKCCYVRKVKPLKKALAGVDLWITGLRRTQSTARKNIPIFSYSMEHEAYKVYPLVTWEETNVWEYIRNNDVPYNKLYDEGYPTIGCAPCCRSVGRAEDIRSGRWWWEKDENKECGIHIEDKEISLERKPLSWNI